MQISCSKCQHKQNFKVEVSEFQGYVCPNCHAYFKGTDPDKWVYQKNLSPGKDVLWPILGEFITFQAIQYQIITKIRRSGVLGKSNEYVGLSTDDEELYLADGDEYACFLEPISEDKIDRKSEKRIKYDGNYNREEGGTQNVIYAEGFVFEDLDAISSYITYAHTLNEDKFISEEIFQGKKEYYAGKYLHGPNYFSMFEKYREFEEKKKHINSKLLGALLPFLLIPGILFYFLYYNQLSTQTLTFNETFTSENLANSFVSTPFELKGNTKKQLVMDGFSISSVPNLVIQVNLVNKKTNQVSQVRPYVHKFNPSNQANALDIDFCRVEPGQYHLVFETSMTGSPNQAVKLEEQIKLKYGGVSYTPLIFTYAATVMIFIFFFINFNQPDKIEELSKRGDFSGWYMIKQDGLLILFFFVCLALPAYKYYEDNMKTCSADLEVQAQVDHTHTGNRIIYTRSPLVSGSHK